MVAVVVQEVRLDNTFSAATASRRAPTPRQDPLAADTPSPREDLAIFAAPTGSQLHHIVRYLQQVRHPPAGVRYIARGMVLYDMVWSGYGMI